MSDESQTGTLLDLALSTGGMVAAVVDPDGAVTWQDEPTAAETTSGDATTARDRGALAEHVSRIGTRAATGGAPVEETVTVATPVTTTQWRVAATPQPRADDAVDRAAVVAVDLTDQYRLLDRTMDAVYTVAADWTVTFWNRRMTDRTGVESSAIVGQSLWDVFGESIPAPLARGYRRVMATGGSDTFEQYVPAPVDRWVECRVVADDEGLTVYSRDITDRREYERELERTNERLEEFVSVVSHDLRNPLTVARGSLELARDHGAAAHFERLDSALERMGALVNDLLKLAREGSTAMEPVSLDLATVAGQCWDNVETGDADVEILAGQTLEADVARLQQLLENLIGNAVTHGGEEVTVTVGDTTDGFYVADDGVGVPSGERERVFESGYSTAADGTGFGLAIVAAIAAAHEWDVVLTESERGGARVEVSYGRRGT